MSLQSTKVSLDNYKETTEKCTRCSQCKFVPMAQSDEFANICPSIDYGQFNAYSGGGKIISSYAYNEGAAKATPAMVESVFACTMCGACDTACKTQMGENVEPFDTMLEFRAVLANEGHVPEKMSSIVAHLEREGSPFGERKQRASWASSLDIKDARTNSVDVILHIGSDNAYDEEQWEQLELIAKLLTKAGVNFGYASDGESDSGGLAYELGFRDVAAKLADDWKEIVGKSGAKTVVAVSASEYAAFKNIYPRMGKTLEGVRILHTTEYLEELLGEGKLQLDMSGDGKVAYHDSCKLGRRSEDLTPWDGKYIRVLNTLMVSDPPRQVNFGTEGNYDAPRALLGRIKGLEVVDFERTREFSYCCGGGCGVKETYPDMADMAANNVLSEAASTGASVMVTGSASCKRNLQEAAKRHGSEVEVTTILDLLAEGGA